jgi:CheY-like chemotaxis protein
MVHGLAVQLGGLLELSSAPGVGTTATLWFPVAAAPPATGRAVKDTRPKPTRPATILVVDDDALIALGTVDMLEDLGHKAISAHSGKRALEILESGQEVDLLLTDQAMPGMTGTELAERARHQRPKLPVLLATGYADLPRNETTSLPRLAKPYVQAQLQSEISRLLGTRAR